MMTIIKKGCCTFGAKDFAVFLQAAFNTLFMLDVKKGDFVL